MARVERYRNKITNTKGYTDVSNETQIFTAIATPYGIAVIYTFVDTVFTFVYNGERYTVRYYERVEDLGAMRNLAEKWIDDIVNGRW